MVSRTVLLLLVLLCSQSARLAEADMHIYPSTREHAEDKSYPQMDATMVDETNDHNSIYTVDRSLETSMQMTYMSDYFSEMESTNFQNGATLGMDHTTTWHHMTSTSSFASAASSALVDQLTNSDNATEGPLVKLICYNCSGIECGEKRENDDPVMRCGANEFCYFQIVKGSTMSTYKRYCMGVDDQACREGFNTFKCRMEKETEVCWTCCRYNKCNYMIWEGSSAVRSMSGVVTLNLAIWCMIFMTDIS